MKSWKELGKAFAQTFTREDRNTIFEKLDLYGSLKMKKEKFIEIANEISLKDNSNIHLNHAKLLFANEEYEGADIAKYMFFWGQNAADILDDVLTLVEASKMWGLDHSTLRKLVNTDRVKIGIDCRQSGKTWLIKREVMERLYGKPKHE